MLVVGLTGGIGSGKSTVANLFAEHGAPIIDTDQVARELTYPGEPALTEIITHFGKRLLQEDGTLNRAMLRELIFSDEKQRAWLENLLHPLIRKKTQEKVQSFSAPYCIIVIPLLIETGPYPFINRILVVDAPEAMRIQRIQQRDKTSVTSIDAIFKAQTNVEKRFAAAQDIIFNQGSLESLREQVEKLHQLYMSL